VTEHKNSIELCTTSENKNKDMGRV